MKNLFASFPFPNGLEMSLPLSCVKNSVIANGRTKFLYSKQRLLTQHIQEIFASDTRPLSRFLGWAWGRGQYTPTRSVPETSKIETLLYSAHAAKPHSQKTEPGNKSKTQWQPLWQLASFPSPSPAFTASDGKLGQGMGTRLCGLSHSGCPCGIHSGFTVKSLLRVVLLRQHRKPELFSSKMTVS